MVVMHLLLLLLPISSSFSVQNAAFCPSGSSRIGGFIEPRCKCNAGQAHLFQIVLTHSEFDVVLPKLGRELSSFLNMSLVITKKYDGQIIILNEPFDKVLLPVHNEQYISMNAPNDKAIFIEIRGCYPAKYRIGNDMRRVKHFLHGFRAATKRSPLDGSNVDAALVSVFTLTFLNLLTIGVSYKRIREVNNASASHVNTCAIHEKKNVKPINDRT